MSSTFHVCTLNFVGTAAFAPQVQKPAPAFKGTAVVDGQFKEINLNDYKGKYLVLFFYPLDLYVFGLNHLAWNDV